MTLNTAISGLFIGKPEARWDGKAPSAIRKLETAGPLHVTKTGLEGDQQADLKVHGGPDKALHFYSADHYPFWETTFPDADFKFGPGRFGENLSAVGINEENTCLGDVFKLGTARVQISQGRQPCWKLNLHTNIPNLAPHFQKTGKTGWYFRVLEEGIVSSGDLMELDDRPHTNWPMHKLIQARFDPRLDPKIAAELAAMETLAENWRAAFYKKTNVEFQEDTSRRLTGAPV